MVQTQDVIDRTMGRRRLYRPRDVFTPSVSLSAFESLGVAGLGFLSLGIDQLQVGECDFAGLDVAPHDSFVRGEMPLYVYADWLEENYPDTHPMVLRMLRGQM